MNKLKVLLGGDAAYKAGSEIFIFNAFNQLNVETRLVDFSEYFRLSFLNKAFNKFRKVPCYWGVDPLNKALIEKTKEFRPNFVLLMKPIHVLPETVKELKKIAKVFSWYPDYVLFPKTCSTYFYKSIPFYDYHFSFNFENAKELKKRGAKESLFLPCAADLSCHYPVKVSPEEAKKIGADVVFLGTFAQEERFFYLEKLCREGYNVKIYGGSWEKCPKDSCLIKNGCIQFKVVNCEEMSKVFNASKIVLSFVRSHNKELLGCRTYEIPACGAFMLHVRTEKTSEVFKEGEEADFFSSYEEMKNKIDFYLKNDELRKKIAAAGYQKIISGGCLFIDRVKVIIDVFNNLG